MTTSVQLAMQWQFFLASPVSQMPHLFSNNTELVVYWPAINSKGEIHLKDTQVAEKIFNVGSSMVAFLRPQFVQ